MSKKKRTPSLPDYIEACRARLPVPDRDQLSPQEEMQCRILGGGFIQLLEDGIGYSLQQRSAFPSMGFDKQPLQVITTSMPGLVALEEIVPQRPTWLVWLLHYEYENWNDDLFERDFLGVVHHWSIFEAMDEEDRPWLMERWPDREVEGFQKHTVGCIWGPRCGSAAHHLWHWDGQELSLLQEKCGQTLF